MSAGPVQPEPFGAGQRVMLAVVGSWAALLCVGFIWVLIAAFSDIRPFMIGCYILGAAISAPIGFMALTAAVRGRPRRVRQTSGDAG